jgi:hypothetical protein
LKHPPGGLSYDDQHLVITFRYILYGWIGFPIAVTGLFLNGFTIAVLLNSKMRSFSTNIYLTALSIANVVVLINFIFLYSLRYIISYNNFKKNIDRVFFGQSLKPDPTISYAALYYESYLNTVLWAWSSIFITFQLFSIYLTCAVTVDRWIYLLTPLKAERICTTRRTLGVIYGIFFFCVIFNIPRWFEVTYDHYVDPHTNKTFNYAKNTAFGNNKLVQSILRYYAYIIYVYVIPFGVLLVVNILIIQKLMVMRKKKMKTSQHL